MNLLKHDNLRWKHYADEAQFDHPISYWGAVLDAREDGHVDLLYRWDPHSACHLHRHTAAVSSLVLEGELTVIDIDLETGQETGRVVKPAGTWVHKAPGDVHVEIGGPEGALVLGLLGTEAWTDSIRIDGLRVAEYDKRNIWIREAMRKISTPGQPPDLETMALLIFVLGPQLPEDAPAETVAL